MNITIERAAPTDAEALTAIQIAAFHEDAQIYPGVEIGGPPGYDDVKVTLARMQEAEFYKIVYEGQIIGGVAVFVQGEGHYHLGIIYIHPGYHGHGMGSAAMTFIEQAYPAAVIWDLHTPTYATRNHHFYEKLGYINVGEVVEPDGFRLIHYEKRV